MRSEFGHFLIAIKSKKAAKALPAKFDGFEATGRGCRAADRPIEYIA